jgi:predicted dehydrogenase
MADSASRQMPILDYQPKLPLNRMMGIGIVGAGDIVVNAHLPAYRIANFRVAGIYDIDKNKAKLAAQLFNIPIVFDSLEQLLESDEIEVVDIAVPTKFQLAIVKKAAEAGKHMLCQKPLAETLAEAVAIVDLCARAGVRAAVNQQMRWAPGIQASRNIVERGWLGSPLQGTIQVNVSTPWELWPWITQVDHLEVMYHSIHYLDSIRYVLGMKPESVYADGARFPGQVCKGETRTLIHFKFPGETRGLVYDNHNNINPQDDWYAMFRFEGTEGSIQGTNGALYNYPVGREDTISFYSRLLEAGRRYAPPLEGRWFPHAFMGSMGELMRAIEENREPDNSVADNLITMQMVFASYRSMSENRPVFLSEFH